MKEAFCMNRLSCFSIFLAILFTLSCASGETSQQGSNLSAVSAPPVTAELVPGTSFNGKVRWLAVNAQEGGVYTVEVTDDESIAPMKLSFGSRNNIRINITGIGPNPVTLSLSANGSMFTVEQGVTLILDDNIELRGRSNNNASLIQVNYGGRLIMNNAKISGNTANRGGGVNVETRGIFTMNNGKISDNIASSSGGGVESSGAFIMNGGEISGNIANIQGGGVYSFGTFTMNNGKISSNIAGFQGGGVYFLGGTFFSMKNGEISSNIASLAGGGVYVHSDLFNKTGGIIYGSTSENSNVVKSSSGTIRSNQGHAVYANHSNKLYVMIKDSTSGPLDNLTYDGSRNPPTVAGEWDF
jgi:hypothetical protein